MEKFILGNQPSWSHGVSKVLTRGRQEGHWEEVLREAGREDATRLIQTRKKEAEAMEGTWPLADGKAKDTGSPRAS